MAKPRRGPAPVPGSPVSIRIESCPLEGIASVRFLGSYIGTFVHFVKKGVRPIPCLGDDCPVSLHKGRKIWKGYAPAEWWQGNEQGQWCPCVWEVSEALNEDLDGLPLRGTVWEISRIPGDNGKPEVRGVMMRNDDDQVLRAAFDVFPLVNRLYGFLDMQWGVKSHIPKRLRLEPTSANPPPRAAKVETSNARMTPEKMEMSDENREKIQEARRGIFPGDARSHFNVDGSRKVNGKAVLS